MATTATLPRLASAFPRRLYSTGTTYTQRPSPPKSHLHAALPQSTLPLGYVLTGVHCGIKKDASKPDLSVVLSTTPRGTTSAAACFTKNAFQAAPVLVSEEILKRSQGRARGVVVNSGCANAVTGKQGLEDAWGMVRATDALLSSQDTSIEGHEETLVMSTGVIGQTLPISKILTTLRSTEFKSSLGSDFHSWEKAAKAFMTTDTFPKLRSRTFKIGGKEYRMAGMDKGAGMIHPDMRAAGTFETPRQLHATLLGLILTDAAVSPRSLQSALTYAVDRSFNSISVDGDMSTNDTVCILANGAASPDQNAVIDEHDTPEAFAAFRDELTSFAADLAQLVVRDGEGATKFVTVTVKGAPTYKDAHAIASRISTSALVKTALYGEDANWGRILAATGSVPLSPSAVTGKPVSINPATVSVTIVPGDGTVALPVLVNGEPEKVDEVRAKEIMVQDEFEIVVDLEMGDAEARYWTCDFSYEYVSINGDYRS